MTRKRQADYRYRCAECGRKRDPDKVPQLSASRYVGGNYRKPPQWYSSSICLECAEGLVEYREEQRAKGLTVGTHVGAKWSASQVEHALERHRAREKQ